jgi:chromosome segregation ATPase
MSDTKEQAEKRLRYFEIYEKLSRLGGKSDKVCIEDLRAKIEKLEDIINELESQAKDQCSEPF